jgi:hypothetical protein
VVRKIGRGIGRSADVPDDGFADTPPIASERERRDEMHPTMYEMMLRADRRNLDRTLRKALLRPERISPAATAETVVLRLSTVWDDESLARLAELEGRTTPAGPHVVAEVGGAVVAARPLGRGPTLGDPFRPTVHLVPLLQLRAKQLRRDRSARRSRAFGAIRDLGRA